MAQQVFSFFMTKNHADSLKPVLNWIVEATPDIKVAVTARSLLREIKGIETWKQIRLTKPEMSLYKQVTLAFPEGATPEGHQFELFGKVPSSHTIVERELGEIETLPSGAKKKYWEGFFKESTKGSESGKP